MKNKLIQQLQILMKQQGMMDYKADFYASYGVSSSKDMSESELQDAIRRLGGKPTMCREKANANTRYMRSEVLKILTTPAPKGLNIPNEWNILNPFIEKHGGKLLSKMTDEELTKFKKKLYSIRESGWSYKTATGATKPVVLMVDYQSISNNNYNA